MSRFEPWDEQVFLMIAVRHGIGAAERLREVHDLVLDNQDKPVLEKLNVVNSYVNNFPALADQVLWHRNDYWATPFETITSYGGDCEDIAIAKYGILRMMGIADKKLGFIYVRNSFNIRHMVLIYMDSPDADPLILDSEHPEVMPSEKRRDIIEIFMFQSDGTLYLIEDDGKNSRRFKARYEGRKLSKWTGAMEREKRNNDLYVKFNRGRSLYPEE